MSGNDLTLCSIFSLRRVFIVDKNKGGGHCAIKTRDDRVCRRPSGKARGGGTRLYVLTLGRRNRTLLQAFYKSSRISVHRFGLVISPSPYIKRTIGARVPIRYTVEMDVDGGNWDPAIDWGMILIMDEAVDENVV